MHFLPLVGQGGLENSFRVFTPPPFRLRALFAPQNLRSAFTLVELLVVIAILAILAALVVPFVRSSIASGDKAACAQNLKVLSAGVMLYAAENNNQVPGEGKAFLTQLTQYVQGVSSDSAKERNDKDHLSYYHCRAALRARSVSFNDPKPTYGYNGNLGKSVTVNGKTTKVGLRLTEIPYPGKTMLAMDGRYAKPTIWNFEVGAGPARSLQPEDYVHGGKVNAAYVDGHVATFAPDDLPADATDVFWDPKGVVP